MIHIKIDKIREAKPKVLALLSVALSMIISFSFIMIYRMERERIKLFSVPEDVVFVETTSTEPGGFDSWIDSFELLPENSQVIADGWAMRHGIPATDYFNTTFLLKNEDGDYYRVKTVKKERSSVTDFFDEGTDYTFSGYSAWGKTHKLAKGRYQACVFLVGQDKSSYLFEYQQWVELSA